MLLYISALRWNEELVTAYRGWARTAVTIGETGEAKSAVTSGLELFPDDPELQELALRVENIEK